MDLPVTIVIKAPNQRIGDQTVDCMLDWTVRKLKQHLTDVYPSQPNEQHQKLIYSGKLLQDHLTLKEVLRQFEDGSTKHTVHLVCSVSPKSESRLSHKKESQSHSRQSSSSSTQSQQSIPETEGLRHRMNRNPSPSNQQYSAADAQNVFNAYSPQMPTMDQFAANMNQFGGIPAEAAMFPGMMSGAGVAYSPEQYMWMQQMYTQYMAQYMQYYQQGGYQFPAETPASPLPGQHLPQQQNAQENGNQAGENGADNMDDIDEEFRQRDWLDYLYTFSRFMVLLGIVYFYSSLTRFFMVAVFFLAVYAYQMGWFGFMNRRPREQENNVQIEQNAGNPQNIPQRDGIDQPNDLQQENGEPNVSETDSANSQVPADQPREPGALQVTWTFLLTFFTSLFPAPPPAVNVN